MTLTEAKVLFDKLRKDKANIIPRDHIFRDHPERGFTPVEVRDLIQGSGRLIDNKMPKALPGSFMWVCKDMADRRCELVILFETVAPGKVIIVASAYREV